jgi:hypothetical protein
VQEVELAEVLDHLLLDRALEGEVELLERLSRGEPCAADARLSAVSVTGRGLGREERLREALIAPFLSSGSLGELRERFRGRRGLHRPEQVLEL